MSNEEEDSERDELSMKQIAELVISVAKDAAEAKALAQEAQRTSKEALVVQTENEQRLKSIQHRVDATEGKMDTMLDGVSQINMKLKENTAVTVGVKTTLKVFMSFLSLITLVVGIIRAIPVVASWIR